MLRQLRDAIFARRDEIADVITRETGKPRVEAIFAESAPRARHRRFSRAPSPALATSRTRAASQPRHESEVRLAGIRSARRRRDHLAVELSVLDSHGAGNSRARGGQRGAAEALRTDAVVRPTGRRTGRTSKISAGSGASAARPRRTRRGNHRSRPGQSFLHRQRRDRPTHRRSLRPKS